MALVQRTGMRRLAVLGFIGALDAGGHRADRRRGDRLDCWFGAFMLGVFILAHAFGPGTPGQTFATMSYPASLRGVGIGTVQIVNRIGGTVGLVLFPILAAAFGLRALLYLAIAPSSAC